METSSEFLLGASVHGSLAVKIDPAFILRRLTTRCLPDCKSAFARTIVWQNLFLKRPSGLLVGKVGTVFWGEREGARPPRRVVRQRGPIRSLLPPLCLGARRPKDIRAKL